MTNRIRTLVLLLLVIILSAIALSAVRAREDSAFSSPKVITETKLTSSQDKSSPPEKTAEQVYKNIQIFKGMPASELDGDMAFISGSLGVRCNYCHVNPFDKDQKPTKLTARKMIQMVFDLNRGSFNGQGAVSCYTCHRGQPQPISVPALGRNLWQPTNQTAKQGSPLPHVEQI